MLTIRSNNRIKNYTAVFSFFMIFSFGAFMLLAPVVGSHADRAIVGAEVDTILALTTTESNVRLQLTPSADGATASDSIGITVDTNNYYGYELYLSSIDENTAMTSESSEDTINSNFETTTLANIPANSWGYSLDGTDYNKIPALSEQTRIKNVDHIPVNDERTSSVHFGVKINSTIASGFYNKNLVLSTVAVAPPPMPTMQTYDTSNLTNVGDSIDLVDERDGNVYTVKKLADGNVWMTQNLRIVNKTLNSALSDLPSGTTYTIPASNISAFTEDYNTNAAYLDNTYGGYYNFYTATAGFGTDSLSSGSSDRSICPKGWRLPTGGPSGEYNNLYTHYNSVALLQGEPGFTLGGIVVGSDGLDYHGDIGAYWSSTIATIVDSYYIFIETSSGDVGAGEEDYDDKYYGFPVRCIAR